MNKLVNKIAGQTKETMTNTLKLPRDIVYGEAILSVTGVSEAFIENYRGILECGNSRIVVQAKHARITIDGRGLEVAYYTAEDMKITGTITGIQFSHMEAVW